MTTAIEAGARAVIAARKKWESREGPFGVYDLGYPDNKIAQPNAVRDFRPEARGAVVARFDTHDEAMAQYEFLTEQHYAKACIEAAIASGELVPASQTPPEAVAWRFRYEMKEGVWGKWTVQKNKPSWHSPSQKDVQIEPLYTATQPDIQAQVAGAVAEMRERCLSIVRKHKIGNGDAYDQHDVGRVVCAKEIEQEILDLSPACGEYVVGWRTMDSVPINKAVLVKTNASDYYGNGGVYAALLVDMGIGRRWHTFGFGVGRDLSPEDWPTGWMPMPLTASTIQGGSE